MLGLVFRTMTAPLKCHSGFSKAITNRADAVISKGFILDLKSIPSLYTEFSEIVAYDVFQRRKIIKLEVLLIDIIVITSPTQLFINGRSQYEATI